MAKRTQKPAMVHRKRTLDLNYVGLDVAIGRLQQAWDELPAEARAQATLELDAEDNYGSLTARAIICYTTPATPDEIKALRAQRERVTDVRRATYLRLKQEFEP